MVRPGRERLVLSPVLVFVPPLPVLTLPLLTELREVAILLVMFVEVRPIPVVLVVVPRVIVLVDGVVDPMFLSRPVLPTILRMNWNRAKRQRRERRRRD